MRKLNTCRNYLLIQLACVASLAVEKPSSHWQCLATLSGPHVPGQQYLFSWEHSPLNRQHSSRIFQALTYSFDKYKILKFLLQIEYRKYFTYMHTLYCYCRVLLDDQDCIFYNDLPETNNNPNLFLHNSVFLTGLEMNCKELRIKMRGKQMF